MLRLALLAGVIMLAAVAATYFFVPSFATIDVSAKTDLVSFETAPGVVLNETRFGVSGATICSPSVAAESEEGGDSCHERGHDTVISSYTGPIRVVGEALVWVRRLADGELEMGIKPLGAQAAVFLTDDVQNYAGLIIVFAARAPAENRLSFGMLVRAASIGGVGVDSASPAPLLVSGTIRALATTSVVDSVVSGPSINLGPGDVIDLSGKSSVAVRGNIFVQADGSGSMIVAARYPTASTTIRRFGGDGVPIAFSWWDRLKADPLVIAVWALIGFWFSILGMIMKVVDAKSEEGG